MASSFYLLKGGGGDDVSTPPGNGNTPTPHIREKHCEPLFKGAQCFLVTGNHLIKPFIKPAHFFIIQRTCINMSA